MKDTESDSDDELNNTHARRTRKRRGYLLPASRNGRPHLTIAMAERRRSVSAVFSRDLPINLRHVASPSGTVPSVDSPRLPSLRYKLWIDNFLLANLLDSFEDIGYMYIGKIDDLTVKPLPQYLFLLTGFSLYTLPRLSHGGGTTWDASRIYGDAADVGYNYGKWGLTSGPFARELVEPPSSDYHSVLSDSDPDISDSDDDKSLTRGEQGRLSTRENSPWLALDEQRLLAYKKEGQVVELDLWQVPGRTPGSIRTRLSIVQAKVK